MLLVGVLGYTTVGVGNPDRMMKYLLWQEGYHGKQIETNKFLDGKLNYNHENLVEGEFVSDAMVFVYSSARNYGGETGVMDVKILG